jgi:D-alanyl-D-alanine endopeptidase (penicillin-binding protein 7)
MKRIVLILALLLCQSSIAATQYVYNVTKEEVVIEYASELVRPIASVTKLMTALVVVTDRDSLEEKVPFGRIRRTKEELLYLMLVKSDNQAAEALARSYPGGRDDFIIKMNIKAVELGMVNTYYDDPSGLSRKNQSTAKDLALLLRHVHMFDKIREPASTASYTITDQSKKKKYRSITINNTNINLLKDYSEIEISKTGFTNPAGKCLAMFVNKNGESFVIVILGEHNTKSVQKVSRHIIDSL